VAFIAALSQHHQLWSVCRLNRRLKARFRTHNGLCRAAGYTGLVPGTFASGKRMLYGRLTKRGNKWQRWAFVEAEIAAVIHSLFFRRHYERVKAHSLA
jgi:Transposase IS116/IS110/IS902 family